MFASLRSSSHATWPLRQRASTGAALAVSAALTVLLCAGEAVAQSTPEAPAQPEPQPLKPGSPQAEPPADSEKTPARVAFEAGELAYSQAKYSAALELFRQADALTPHAATRFNIALCLEKMNETEAAEAEYEALLQRDDLSAQQLALANQRLNELRARAAPVSADPVLPEPNVSSPPAGAQPSEKGLTLAPAIAEPSLIQTSSPLRPGTLSWVGGGLAAVGLAGGIVFRVRAVDAEEKFDRAPTDPTGDRSEELQRIANVGWWTGGIGVALVAIDLLFLQDTDAVSSSSEGVVFRF